MSYLTEARQRKDQRDPMQMSDSFSMRVVLERIEADRLLVKQAPRASNIIRSCYPFPSVTILHRRFQFLKS